MAECDAMGHSCDRLSRRRRLGWLVVLLAVCTTACAALAQARSPNDSDAAMAAGATPATMPRTAWSALSVREQQALAPLREQWDQASPNQQANFRRVAARWQSAPAPQREAIGQRLARWASMTPQQRAVMNTRAQQFRQLSPQQQQQVREAAQRFRSMPPEQRKALRERFEKAPHDARKRVPPHR